MNSLKKLSSIEQLQRARNLLLKCPQAFLDRFTAEELLQLWRMYHVCEYDIPPHQWTEEQINLALNGIAPSWDDDTEPVTPTVH
jgi:hypothetical protein